MADQMADQESSLLGTTIPIGAEEIHSEMLFLRYIETLSLPHACKLIVRWNAHPSPDEYIAKILRELPRGYFQHPRLLPSGTRFVYADDGHLVLKRMNRPLPMQQLHQDSTLGFVGTSEPLLPAPMPQRRLRPLNSFMVFRSYLSPEFPGLPQKVKSIAISAMWQDDVLKEQWVIMAKAYTILRDHFHMLGTFSLPDFVQMAAGMMALPASSEYIVRCGWNVKKLGSSVSVTRAPHGDYKLPPMAPPAQVTVKELVNAVRQAGHAIPHVGEWPLHIEDDGSVYAIDPNLGTLIPEPQDWVLRDVPRWPIEEFEADEMYSILHPEHDQNISPIGLPSNDPREPEFGLEGAYQH
ncbi:transcriptional regulator family: HMG [Penicillium bovifimosum]|uniref:Transcriptional regulator family: HMG n=1 Tax=Penicillium bovifimosum TaxID=126998 RepID=A0A9W9GNC2_9EURO|nr:transcriptional regulator family: HMG [Penicillium bovifimosum]XP_056519023.1 transcriptional regulator family: HMG [Penicillium bovifimosum]KAJ5124620.1 transcriptional regulator family: HMG [Penicillium bovifimosum]KAJ5124624.1 transcriptional regulator family: HMG [Penicillium bovifimosum]